MLDVANRIYHYLKQNDLFISSISLKCCACGISLSKEVHNNILSTKDITEMTKQDLCNLAVKNGWKFRIIKEKNKETQGVYCCSCKEKKYNLKGN